MKLAAWLQSILFDAGEDPGASHVCVALMAHQRMDLAFDQFVPEVRS